MPLKSNQVLSAHLGWIMNWTDTARLLEVIQQELPMIQFANHVISWLRLKKKKKSNPFDVWVIWLQPPHQLLTGVGSAVSLKKDPQSDILRMLRRAEFCLHPPRDERHNGNVFNLKAPLSTGPNQSEQPKQWHSYMPSRFPLVSL